MQRASDDRLYIRFCDIQNNQGLRKDYQPQPSASADNPSLDLDYSGYHMYPLDKSSNDIFNSKIKFDIDTIPFCYCSFVIKSLSPGFYIQLSASQWVSDFTIFLHPFYCLQDFAKIKEIYILTCIIQGIFFFNSPVLYSCSNNCNRIIPKIRPNFILILHLRLRRLTSTSYIYDLNVTAVSSSFLKWFPCCVIMPLRWSHGHCFVWIDDNVKSARPQNTS